MLVWQRLRRPWAVARYNGLKPFSSEHYAAMRPLWEMLAGAGQKAPGLRVSLAGNRPPSQFEGIEIHNCCFALHKLSDELIAEAEARRRKGFITSYYVCGELPESFGKLARKFDRHAAVKGNCDWTKLREDALGLVNSR